MSVGNKDLYDWHARMCTARDIAGVADDFGVPCLVVRWPTRSYYIKTRYGSIRVSDHKHPRAMRESKYFMSVYPTADWKERVWEAKNRVRLWARLFKKEYGAPVVWTWEQVRDHFVFTPGAVNTMPVWDREGKAYGVKLSWRGPQIPRSYIRSCTAIVVPTEEGEWVDFKSTTQGVSGVTRSRLIKKARNKAPKVWEEFWRG